jgi:hypothetical protein
VPAKQAAANVVGKATAGAVGKKVEQQPSGGKKWHYYEEEDTNVDGLLNLYLEPDADHEQLWKAMQQAGAA